MNSPNCEELQMAAMAIADGERSNLSPEVVGAHLQACSTCASEVRGLGSLSPLLDTHDDEQIAVDLWPYIRGRLAPIRRSLVPFDRRGHAERTPDGSTPAGLRRWTFLALKAACLALVGGIFGLFLSASLFSPGRAEAEALRAECASDLLASLNLALQSITRKDYLYTLEAELPKNTLDRSRVRNILIAEDTGMVFDSLERGAIGRQIELPSVDAIRKELGLATRGNPIADFGGNETISCWTYVETRNDGETKMDGPMRGMWICVVLDARHRLGLTRTVRDTLLGSATRTERESAGISPAGVRRQ